MSSKRIVTKFLLRRDTAANFYDVVPSEGEPVYTIDTYELKIGDGHTVWQDLPSHTGNFVVGISVFRQAGTSGTIPPTGEWTQNYVQGTKAQPWVWTRLDFRFQNGQTTSIYNPQYDASWQDYTFIGIEAPVETTFPCAVNGSDLSIGGVTDMEGSVTTTGVFTPQGTIEVS